MPDISKHKISVSSRGNLYSRKVSSGEYIIGDVATPWDFVRVYAQEDMWSLEFIWGGCYYRTQDNCKKLPSNLSLTRKASKFARLIVEKDGKNTNLR